MFRRAGVLLTTILSLAGAPFALAQTEQPRYEVLEASENLELRLYSPTLVAEVTVPGDRDEAVNAGFRILAAYIFGDNAPRSKIAMTAPVTQKPSGEKIDMTAPVTQSGKAGAWTVAFTMPSRYTLETIPKPTDARIKLRKVAGQRVAAIRFSGFATDASLAENRTRLATWMKLKSLKAVGEARFAYYDPPWTLPFLRRNEVLWIVQ